MCIDLDHQTEQDLDNIRQTIVRWPFVLAFFRSPSGDGLKVIVRTDNYSIGDYGNCYRQVEQLFTDVFGIKPDKLCEDLSHPCFISYDPDMYYYPDAQPWPYVYDPAFDKVNLPKTQNTLNGSRPPKPLNDTEKYIMRLKQEYAPLSDEQIMTILVFRWRKSPNYYQDGNRTRSIFIQACTLCKAGIVESKALNFIKWDFLPTGYDERKLEWEVNQAYKKNCLEFGTERNKYKPYHLYKQKH